jgi:hypothetical protein
MLVGGSGSNESNNLGSYFVRRNPLKKKEDFVELLGKENLS